MANPIIFGKYHLIDRISAGGMAEVFRAKSYGVAGFEKIIVIKKILPHLSKDKEFIDMFLDEARISVSLSHANVVQVIDLGKEGDSYFMALEYVHGQDLSRTIVQSRKAEALGIARSLFIMAEVLKGLDYAHRRKDRNYQDLNIVHCDVSPQNILLSYEGEVKVTDFGISRAAFQSASSRGVVRGKYAYMSPEQVEGKELDRRSDVFSIGIILHELLTGRRLFKRESVDKTLRAVVMAKVPAIREVVPEVDDALERIVAKALARNRDERYTDAAEMLDELSSYMFSRGIHVTSTDLSSYLHRLFASELEARRDPVEVGSSTLRPFRTYEPGDGEHTPRPDAPMRTIFIPAGSSRTIPTYEHREAEDQPLILGRLNVVVMAMEWFLRDGVEGAAVEALERRLHRRFEDRIRAMHGDLWEVNHNGMVAVWIIEDDPGGVVAEAMECALALRGEELVAAEEGFPQQVTLAQALHAGSVLVERESTRPLLGWQLSRTFALPRVLINQVAPAGRLLITEAIRELAGARFELKAGEALAPGATVPPIYDLIGRSGPMGGARVPWSPVTRVLGQVEKVRVLEARLREVDKGSPVVLLLLGEEGSGRGRHREVLQLATRKAGVPYFSTHADPESPDVAYGAVTDLLRRIAGLQPDEGGPSGRQKLARLAQLGLGPEDVELVQSLFDEAPVPEDDRSRRGSRICQAIEKIVAGLCRDRALVLVFEEVDRFDALSMAVVRHLVATLGRRRLMLVVTGEAREDAPWLKGAPVLKMASESLSEKMVSALVQDMLAVSEVDQRLVRELVRRAQGHPLWTKEMVAELADSGAIRIESRKAQFAVQRWPLPETLKELLALRLKWLPDRSRQLLSFVAVLGQEFPLIGAEWLMGRDAKVRQRLQPAIDVGILQERQVGQTVWFRFQHGHFRELALAELSPEARAEVAPRLMALLDGHPEYMRGRRIELYARAAREGNKANAGAHLEAAGDKLAGEGGDEAALRWYRAALAATRDGARGRAVRRKVAHVLGAQGRRDEALKMLQEVLEAARKGSDPREIADLELEVGRQLTDQGKLREAEDVLSQAMVSASRAQAPELRVHAERELGVCLMKLGNLDAAATHVKAAYANARELSDPVILLKSAAAIGFFSVRIGDYRRALESYRRCFTAARDLNRRELILEALSGMGLVYHHAGQLDQAHQSFKEALALAQELGDTSEQTFLMSRIGALYAEEGRLDRAAHALQLAIQGARASGQIEVRLHAEIHLGYVRACRGETREGVREVKRAMEEATERGMSFLVAGANYYLGRVQALAGDPDGARASFNQALKLARAQKEPRIARLAGQALGGGAEA